MTTSYSSYNSAYSYDANGNIQTLKRNGTAENLEMDNLTYHYFVGTNKLQYITDSIAHTNYDIDIDDQSPKNYYYDKTGNLIQDVSEEIGTIKWTSTGKVREVIRTKHSIKPDIEFFYDANDNRIGKLIKPKNPENGLSDKKTWKYTFYSRDHSGNIMATYNIQYNNDTNLYVLSLKEQMLYGSNLLGVYNDSIVIGFSNYIKFNPDNHLEVIGPILHILDEQQSYLDTNYFATMHKYHGFTGKIQYGLKNHLGNVHTTISDKPLFADKDGDGLVDEKHAIILSSLMYYPYGFPKINYSFNSEIYRFGFNAGSEKDDEIAGITGSHFTTFYREGATREVFWWTPDPKPHPSWSPYAMMDCNPILNNDALGDSIRTPKKLFNSSMAGKTGYNAEGLNLVDWKTFSEGVQGVSGITLNTPSVGDVNLTVVSIDKNVGSENARNQYKMILGHKSKHQQIEISNNDPNVTGSHNDTQYAFDKSGGYLGTMYNQGVLTIDLADFRAWNKTNSGITGNVSSKAFGVGLTILHENLHNWGVGMFGVTQTTLKTWDKETPVINKINQMRTQMGLPTRVGHKAKSDSKGLYAPFTGGKKYYIK